MTPEGYEYFDVAADVGVAAWGADLPGCLRQWALGVFNLIVPTVAVEPLEGREVAARGASVEALLVNWLNECLYVHDLEGFVISDLSRPEVTRTWTEGIQWAPGRILVHGGTPATSWPRPAAAMIAAWTPPPVKP